MHGITAVLAVSAIVAASAADCRFDAPKVSLPGTRLLEVGFYPSHPLQPIRSS
jgi:hypothetical protein